MSGSKIVEISKQVEAITGTAPFCYATSPTSSTTKWVFQDMILRTEAAALQHVETLLAQAPARKLQQLEALKPGDTISTSEGLRVVIEIKTLRDEAGNIDGAKARWMSPQLFNSSVSDDTVSHARWLASAPWMDLLVEGWQST